MFVIGSVSQRKKSSHPSQAVHDSAASAGQSGVWRSGLHPVFSIDRSIITGVQTGPLPPVPVLALVVVALSGQSSTRFHAPDTQS